MREVIRQALTNGLPCIAECGGFMYLQEQMEGSDGKDYDMVGFLTGRSYKTEKLQRFGYVTLSGGKVFGQSVGEITAHEFHYYDSEECGNTFLAKKPLSRRQWNCMISTGTLFAGYPHMHYQGNPEIAKAFVNACEAYAKVGEKSISHNFVAK